MMVCMSCCIGISFFGGLVFVVEDYDGNVVGIFFGGRYGPMNFSICGLVVVWVCEVCTLLLCC